jgi:hypothetical protein
MRILFAHDFGENGNIVVQRVPSWRQVDMAFGVRFNLNSAAMHDSVSVCVVWRVERIIK